jgi:hypothetical protein
MEPILIGYFPKKVAVPDGYDAPKLKDICSVSTCIAEGPPDGWIDRWSHNANWVFPTRERALLSLAGVDPSAYSIHAYRVLPSIFRDGDAAACDIDCGPPSWEPTQVELEPLPVDFVSLGFDAVETPDGCDGFSCSPLSCNGGWQKFTTNRHCLMPSLTTAIELAKEFSLGGWEPGPYRVVEVLGSQIQAVPKP